MELAFVAPVCVALLLGMIEAARLYDVQTNLATAVREGARLAAMDRSDMDLGGCSLNDKMAADVRNYLDSVGLPGDCVDVVIATANDPEVPFDFDDPNNDLELFRLRVELLYSDINPLYPLDLDDPSATLVAEVFFRNARAAIAQ